MLLTCIGLAPAALAQSTPFSWQGRLLKNGLPVNGNADFQFSLHEAGGAQINGVQTILGVTVTDGLYSVLLNQGGEFGPDFTLFNGRPLFLKMSVRSPAGAGAFVLQGPDRAILPVPLALGLKLPFVARAAVAAPNCVIHAINTGTGKALCGETASSDTAVYGRADGANGTGTYGEANIGASSYGVWGLSNNGVGVYGSSTAGRAMRGVKNAPSGLTPTPCAIWGDSNNSYGMIGTGAGANMSGTGGVFNGGTGILATLPCGVWGESNAGHGTIGTTSLIGATGVGGSVGGGAGFPAPASAGVWGDSALGDGVNGTSSLNGGNGVFGRSDGPLSLGVHGYNAVGYGNMGVFFAQSALPLFVGFRAGVLGDTTIGNGVIGFSGLNGGVGVGGKCDGVLSAGMRGQSNFGFGVVGDSAANIGVFGQRGGASLTNLVGVFGPAVWGDTNTGNGVMGTSSAINSAGVFGKCDNPTGAGVSGKSPDGTGVAGGTNTGIGVLGVRGALSGIDLTGVLAPGVWGDSNIGNGVLGTSTANNGCGVYGRASGATAIGVGGVGLNGALAGRFDGDVTINGTLNATAKNFLIDHPLDPENKLLAHACIESDQRVNIYSGNAVTDAAGTAVVQLPEYFEALNTDVRYQLTVIGEFAQAIVAAKVRENRFTIRTDKPNIEVSWQVTGTRNDAYARAHPMRVELAKSDGQRGRYLHPAEHGAPSDAALAIGLIQTDAQFPPAFASAQQTEDAPPTAPQGIGPGAISSTRLHDEMPCPGLADMRAVSPFTIDRNAQGPAALPPSQGVAGSPPTPKEAASRPEVPR